MFVLLPLSEAPCCMMVIDSRVERRREETVEANLTHDRRCNRVFSSFILPRCSDYAAHLSITKRRMEPPCRVPAPSPSFPTS